MLATRRWITFGFCALSAAAIAVSAATAVAGAAQTTDVQVIKDGYVPGTLTVRAGTEIRFRNTDTDIHTATSKTGAFDSNLLFPGDSYAVTLNAPGTYEYFCLPHPWLNGTIVVE